jgi:hypothetical protein
MTHLVVVFIYIVLELHCWYMVACLQLRAKAHARGIPFVSINAPTAEELRLVLMPVSE